MGKENPGNAVNLLCEGTVIVGDIKTKTISGSTES